MRLVRDSLHLADRISDANGMNRPAGAQASERAVVVPRAVADAMAAPVERRQRNEQHIRRDFARLRRRLGNVHRTGNRSLAGTPIAENERESARSDRQRGRETLIGERAQQGERIGLVADRVETGDDARSKEPRQSQTFVDQASGERQAPIRVQGAPARERACTGRGESGIMRV